RTGLDDGDEEGIDVVLVHAVAPAQLLEKRVHLRQLLEAARNGEMDGFARVGAGAHRSLLYQNGPSRARRNTARRASVEARPAHAQYAFRASRVMSSIWSAPSVNRVTSSETLFTISSALSRSGSRPTSSTSRSSPKSSPSRFRASVIPSV